jgi:DNA-binding transcriptional LysR family regulator
MVMELRDIEYFAIVAEQKHVGRAAEILGLSQPALSKSLKRLEHSLQVKLFKRTPKGVEPTAEVTALLRRVHELRLAVQSVVREIADVSQGHVGHLRIGVGAAISEQFLSAAFATMLETAPRTRLKVIVSDNDVMLPALRNGELDLIVNYVTLQTPEGVTCEYLYDDDQFVCASSNHPLAGKNKLTPADLEQEQWVLSEATVEASLWLQGRVQDRGLHPLQVAFESRSAELRLRTVASSKLLAFASHGAIELAKSLGLDVRPLAVDGLARSRQVGVISQKETYLPPAVGRFIEILKQTTRTAMR